MDTGKAAGLYRYMLAFHRASRQGEGGKWASRGEYPIVLNSLSSRERAGVRFLPRRQRFEVRIIASDIRLRTADLQKNRS